MTRLANHIEYMLDDRFTDICDTCPLFKSDYHDDSCDYEASVECPINILWENSEVMADAIRGLTFVQNNEFLKKYLLGEQ